MVFARGLNGGLNQWDDLYQRPPWVVFKKSLPDSQYRIVVVVAGPPSGQLWSTCDPSSVMVLLRIDDEAGRVDRFVCTIVSRSNHANNDANVQMLPIMRRPYWYA
jgi:hypothetical protein